ncbi:MAG TPA: alpha/beta hydrolase [Deltaproteobacteria bacterium]|nr:alpha/beta hydrolase [Deltaproteobacteria bacterium]HDH98508.1 alpha/beta hydrolase [Deltaproteobacteria bacterium]
MWQIFLQSVILITAIYVGLVAFLFFTQSRLIYFPTSEIVATPDQIGLSYKSVSFKAPDGVKLSGWFIPADSPRGVVIFCHGNAGNISHRLESIEIFHGLRLSTFIFDYRGYGASEGTPSEEGSYLDVKGAWNYLIEHEGLASSDIILFGRSLGGAVAAWLAGQYTPKALIIESTFTSAPDLAGELYFYLPVKLLCRYKYNALAAIREVQCPVLIVHSQEDEIVSFRHGRVLFDAANDPRVFLEISGSHNEGFITSSSVYLNGLKAFLDQVDGNKF